MREKVSTTDNPGIKGSIPGRDNFLAYFTSLQYKSGIDAINSLIFNWHPWILYILKLSYIYLLVATCPALNLPNGLVEYNSSVVNGQYPVNTEALLICNQGYYHGYYKIGVHNATTCDASGNWKQPLPMCYDSNEFIFTKTPVQLIKQIC